MLASCGRTNAGQLLQTENAGPGMWIYSSVVTFQPQWPLLFVPEPRVGFGCSRGGVCVASPGKSGALGERVGRV